MWTSNTLMKIDTRVYSPSARPSAPRSSGGGGTLAIIVIRPSAGATISFSPRGVVRIGSRKKVATQMVSADQQPADDMCQCSRKANSGDRRRRRPHTCGLPGGRTGKRHLTVVVGSGLSCLSSAGMRASLRGACRQRHNAAVALRIAAPSSERRRTRKSQESAHGQDQGEEPRRRARRRRDDPHHLAMDPRTADPALSRRRPALLRSLASRSATRPTTRSRSMPPMRSRSTASA